RLRRRVHRLPVARRVRAVELRRRPCADVRSARRALHGRGCGERSAPRGLCGECYTRALAVMALLGAIFEYRTRLRAGRERGLVIFVGVQLAWLVFVLLQNGLL